MNLASVGSAPPPPPPGGPLDRLARFLGLRRSIVGLLVMVLLLGLGERMAERFLPLYLLALGGGALTISLFQGMNVLLGAVYSYPSGYLADRLGAKRALLVFNLLAMAGYLIVIAVPSWPAVFIGAALFLGWTAVSMPATMKLIVRVLPARQRTMGVSINSLIRRLPMALGPVVGGWFIYHWGEHAGIRLAFLAAAVLAGVAILVQQRLIEEEPAGTATSGDAGRFRPVRLLREMSGPLRMLLLSDILIRFCEQIPYAFVVVWCTKLIADPVSAVAFGALTAIEMTTAVLVYIPVAYYADRLGKKPFVLITFVFFALFPLTLLFCHSFWPLVAAFVLRGLKEFGEPTRKALIVDLCPADRKATMFGFYYLIRDLIVAFAAAAGGLLWKIGPSANLLTAFAVGVFGTLLFARYGWDVTSADSTDHQPVRP